MFLQMLNNRERELFLDACYYASRSDEVILESEEELVKAYCREMDIGIPEVLEPDCSLDTVTKEFSKSDKQIKNAVLCELLGVLFVDGQFLDVERDFFYSFAKDIGVSEDDAITIEKALKDYYENVRILQKIVLR